MCWVKSLYQKNHILLNKLSFLLTNKIREILLRRYVLLHKISTNYYCNLWLAKDCKNDILVNLKIHKSAPQFLEAAFDECEILQGLVENMVSEEWNLEMY
jgi:hypothetical protein